jgi:glycosyltransferase involved in cell wall biosynthesis
MALAIISHRRIIVHLHGGDFERFYQLTNRIMKQIVKRTMARVSRVIVLGKSLKHLFSEVAPGSAIDVVPNGIGDIAESGLTMQASRIDDRISVVFLSNFFRSKGLIELIKAIPLVIRESERVRFTIAGSWYRERTKREALWLLERNKLWDHVEFPGRVLGQEKASLLMGADIFVFPPIGPEGQPLVLLEAMSAALPIVTTDQGCIAETVIHGVNGFIVEPGNVEELAGRILELAADAKLRELMGRRSRERFLKLYTQDIFAQNIGSVFARVAGNWNKSMSPWVY